MTPHRMLSALARKGRQVADDPVLRRWLLRRAFGLEPAPPRHSPGRPPYLQATGLVVENPVWQGGAAPAGSRNPAVSAVPAAPISLPLAGETVELSPEAPAELFERRFDDLETTLSAHRFAWLPLLGDAADPVWVASLWQAWAERYGARQEGWPWHPYTAAERAINIIDFGRRQGLPAPAEEMAALLARHAEAIAANLEYFGDHYTSNHLSNNGRGLLRIGVAVGDDGAARQGATIMVAEAGRIFGRSGVLREGSTHYHALITRNYLDAWQEASSAGLPEAPMLRDIAARAVAAARALVLPGGMPLVGDISPDCPPSHLALLTGGAEDGGWAGMLTEDRRVATRRLIAGVGEVSPDRVAEDGWHRFGAEGWQALAFVPPDGWPPMPGHGHQDLGGFELHCDDVPVLVDPGRGSYRDIPADRRYLHADVHNGIVVDGSDPAPVNRPYYSAGFRTRVAGAPPRMSRTRNGRRLTMSGFGRLAGVGEVAREWRFMPDRVEIRDRVEGSGSHTVRRQFCTRAGVVSEGGTAILDTGSRRFRLSAGAAVTALPLTCWRAYGAGDAGRLIVTETPAKLPFEAVTVIERL